MAWNELDHITAEKLNAMDTGGIFADGYFIYYNEGDNVRAVGDFGKALAKLLSGTPVLTMIFSEGVNNFGFEGSYGCGTDGTYIYVTINSTTYLKWGINGVEEVHI